MGVLPSKSALLVENGDKKLFASIGAQFDNQILVKYKNFRDLRLAGVMGNDELGLAAIDCAAALFHFREYIPEEHRMSRKEVSSRCPAFKLVADVTNAIKHGGISREPVDGPALLQSTNDIYELGVTVDFEGMGDAYSHSEPVVCVSCSDGKSRCLDEALVDVVNFWGLELKRIGAQDFQLRDHLPFPGSTFISREDARSLRIRATVGHQFAMNWKFMKFDNEAGFARPIDLTGADVQFRAIPLKYRVHLNIKVPGGDEDYVHAVELSDAQCQEYFDSTTDAERVFFLTRLAAENQNEINEGLALHVKRQLCDKEE